VRAPTLSLGDNQAHVLLCRFSVSNDLKYDAERDLKDIEASHIPVHALNKVEERSNAVLENQPVVALRWICCRVQSSSHFCLCIAVAGSELLAVSFSQHALPTLDSCYFYTLSRATL